MTLHIFTSSSANLTLLEECCRALREGDALIVLGEAVHAAAEGSAAAKLLESLPAAISLHVLSEDCSARGVGRLPARFVASDYSAFVALACAHARSVSWF